MLARDQQPLAVAAGQQFHRIRDPRRADEIVVLTGGLISTPRNCERKAMKPTAAPTNRIATVPTTTARSHPRGRAAGAFGDPSSCCKLMRFGDPLPTEFYNVFERSGVVNRCRPAWRTEFAARPRR